MSRNIEEIMLALMLGALAACESGAATRPAPQPAEQSVNVPDHCRAFVVRELSKEPLQHASEELRSCRPHCTAPADAEIATVPDSVEFKDDHALGVNPGDRVVTISYVGRPTAGAIVAALDKYDATLSQLQCDSPDVRTVLQNVSTRSINDILKDLKQENPQYVGSSLEGRIVSKLYSRLPFDLVSTFTINMGQQGRLTP